MAVLIWVIARVSPPGWRSRPWALPVAVLAAGIACVIADHLEFGQINVFLMGLVLADVLRRDDTRAGRWLPRGVLVGIAIAIKLTPGLFVVFFLLSRQWRLSAVAVATAAGATLLTAAVLPVESWQFWTGTLWGLSDRVALGADVGTYGNGSLAGGLTTLGAPGWLITAAQLVAGVLVVAVAVRIQRQGRALDAWLVVGLGAPLVSPVSWVHHWVYLVPAGVVIVARFGHSWWLRAGGGLVLLGLWSGPGRGQGWIDGGTWLAVPGVPLRQILMIATITAIALLALPDRGREDL